jgi:hypothetical protein
MDILLLPLFLYQVDGYLWQLRIEAVVFTFEQILELIVLLWDFFTTRWVHFYERQQRRDQERQPVGIPSSKKLIFILFLYFCLFLLLLLEII